MLSVWRLIIYNHDSPNERVLWLLGSGRRLAALRYSEALHDAFARTIGSLRGVTPSEFHISELSQDTDVAWTSQWVPHNTRQPPEGGWHWPKIRRTYRPRTPSRFQIAIWHDDRLCGVSVGYLNNTATVIDAVEGSPAPDCPLKGAILLIVLQAATFYAQGTGRAELWLMEPAPGLLTLYTRDYGFSLETPHRGRPYCCRRI
jgi:hypothetical protein